MAGMMKGFLNAATDIVKGDADAQAMKYIANGAKKTAVKANQSAAEQGMFARALTKAKGSKFGTMLTADATRATENMAVSKEVAQKLKDESMVLKQAMMKGNVDNAEAAAAMVGRYEDVLQNGITKKVGMGDHLASYYGHEAYGTGRKIATGGAVAGAMLGGRLITGGNLTHNGNGERDIVGIPFI